MSIAGVDVSTWQQSIDWTAVADPAQGLTFAVTKATEGVGFTDPSFLANVTAIRATSLIPGHYHYARPDLNPGLDGAAREAEWFLSRAGWRAGEIIQLDFEAPAASGDQAGWALAWLDHVAAATGSSPFFYSYRTYIDTRGGQSFAALAAKYPLWIAGVTGDPQPPWASTAIWQDAGQSHFVSGISGGVDYDTFFGSRTQLLAYGGTMALDPNDPVVVSIQQQIAATQDNVGKWTQAQFQQVITALQAMQGDVDGRLVGVVAELDAIKAEIQAGGISPDAVVMVARIEKALQSA